MNEQKQPPVLPWDAHNQKLVSEVHPTDWKNPTPASRYNLVVIGGGTAGLVSAVGAAASVREAAAFGVDVPAGTTVDCGKVMERMRRLRADIRPHDSAKRFSELGVDIFLGAGQFTGPNTIEVGGQTLRFAKGAIPTGARAADSRTERCSRSYERNLVHAHGTAQAIWHHWRRPDRMRDGAEFCPIRFGGVFNRSHTRHFAA